MGDRAHFYLISIAAIGTLYRYSRQPLETSVYIVQRKINGDTTKIDLQIITPHPYRQEKILAAGYTVYISTFPREPDIVRYLLTQAFTLH